MVTISRIVEKIIELHPFMQEALSRGILNYAALAEELKPKIDQELKESAQIPAIMMALRRLSEKLEKTFAKRAKFSKDTDIFIKSDLFELTIKKSEKTFSLIEKMYTLIDADHDFLTVTQGLTQVTLIANKRNREKIIEVFNRERKVKEISNLAAISIPLPIHAIEEAGYLYIITRAFAWEDISIIELVSTLSELTLILKEQDIPCSFSVLKKVIEENI